MLERHPGDPSLEKLKRRAEELREAARRGDAATLAYVREFLPHATEVGRDLTLDDARLVIARAYGFSAWSELEEKLDVVALFFWEPLPSPSPTSPVEAVADTLVRLACVNYGDWHPSHAAEARRLLGEHPEISRANLFAAATVGDVAAARQLLDRDATLANARGGPLGWEPLLYAAYSRLDSNLPAHSTLEVARLLLQHGADPNAGFLWRGNVPPFTALTGAFGEGEDGSNQPPHRHRDALARLLLDAGADPNDGQTLYNRHFNPDDGHLRLLFAYGLGQDKRGPWFARLGERILSPGKMLVEELWAAAKMNFPRRVELLVEHGVDVDAPSFRDGRTPHAAAILAGNREIAAFLRRHGAIESTFTSAECFAAACVAGEQEEALALLAKDPGLLDSLGVQGRAELLSSAVGAKKPAGLQLMAGLGFELDALTGERTPLHAAAWSGDLTLVKLLLELGADPNIRDPNYDATPLGWAAHNHQQAVVEYLTQRGTRGTSEAGTP